MNRYTNLFCFQTNESLNHFILFVFYSILTKRVVRGFELASDADGEFREFTDSNYQFMLPMHARSTTSTAIKNNMKITEFITEPNIITNMEKVSEKIVKT